MTAFFRTLLCLTLLVSGLAQAEEREHTLTIINHFPVALIFSVDRYGEIVPNLEKSFRMEPNGLPVFTKVVSGDQDTIAYLSATPVNLYPDPEKRVKAIFGAGVTKQDNRVFVHGYLGDNIAYSWYPHNQYNITLVFCDPDDYPCEE